MDKQDLLAWAERPENENPIYAAFARTVREQNEEIARLREDRAHWTSMYNGEADRAEAAEKELITVEAAYDILKEERDELRTKLKAAEELRVAVKFGLEMNCFDHIETALAKYEGRK